LSENILQNVSNDHFEKGLERAEIAIFASGAGSNAKAIIEASLKKETNYTVALIVCNKPNAGVLQVATDYNIPTLLIEKERFDNSDGYVEVFKKHKIDLIVLAGFLWKVPNALVKAFEQKIINIHPALLPKYGGKGMYGDKVHQAVIENKEKESGITIHYVNEVYDDGKIIFQAICAVAEKDTVETLADKIHQLEHEHYWKVVDEILGAGK
jgi:phosphoribosylglycinamide formyltransferase-1